MGEGPLLIEYHPEGGTTGTPDQATGSTDTTTPMDPEKISTLVAMLDISNTEAEQLLRFADGDLEKATTLHFEGSVPSGPPPLEPLPDFKYDMNMSAATMWGLHVGVDMQRKEAAKKALTERRMNGMPAGLAYEDHAASLPWLHPLLLALYDVALSRDTRARAELFAAATGVSSPEPTDPSQPLDSFPDLVAKLTALLTLTSRSAISAAQLGNKLKSRTASTLFDTWTMLLDAINVPALKDHFAVSISDTNAYLDESGKPVFAELDRMSSALGLDLKASHVIGAQSVHEALKKRFAPGSTSSASGQAKVPFLEDSNADLPPALLISLDTQYRGKVEPRIALDPFVRSVLDHPEGTEADKVAKELETAKERLKRLQPEKAGHLKALLNHFRAVGKSTVELEGLLQTHEKMSHDLNTTIVNHEATLAALFDNSRYIYRLRAAFFDNPSQLLLHPSNTAEPTIRLVDAESIPDHSYEWDHPQPARALLYVREPVPVQSNEVPDGWWAIRAANDNAVFEKQVEAKIAGELPVELVVLDNPEDEAKVSAPPVSPTNKGAGTTEDPIVIDDEDDKKPGQVEKGRKEREKVVRTSKETLPSSDEDELPHPSEVLFTPIKSTQ